MQLFQSRYLSRLYSLISFPIITFLFFHGLISNSHRLHAQSPSVMPAGFTPLQSKGEIPEDIRYPMMGKLDETLGQVVSSKDRRMVRRAKTDFTIEHSFSTDHLMLSGRVLFGDEATGFIDRVAGKVFEQAGVDRKDLRFYTIRSEDINALTGPTGIILVNLGLLANLDSEAELAYIICHEVQHYFREHAINHYVENVKIESGKGNYSGLTFQEKVETMYDHSKENEFEADSLGLLMYLKTGYSPDVLAGLFDKLYYAYLPCYDEPFPRDFFDRGEFFIPASFYPDTMKPVGKVGAINDRFLTHPNIPKRKAALDRILETQGKIDGKDFLVSQVEFEGIRQQARMEVIRLNLLDRSYGTAVYHAMIALKNNPGNEFLESAIGKGLYGLAKYKNAEEFHKVAIGSTHMEGQSQPLHALFKQMTKVQLNTLALRYILDLKKKYPGRPVWTRLEDDLIRDLVVLNKVKAEDFWSVLPGQAILDTLRLPPSGGPRKLPAWRKKQENFYRLAFLDEMKDPSFRKKFSGYEKDLKKIELHKTLSWEEIDRLEYKEWRNTQKHGLKMDRPQILILDPFYMTFSGDGPDYEDSFEAWQEVAKLLYKSTRERKGMIYNNRINLASKSIDDYNRFCRVQEWIQERENHGSLGVLSVFPENLESVYGDQLPGGVLQLNVFENKSNTFGVFDLTVYDALTGKILFEDWDNDTRLNRKRTFYYLEQDLNVINF